MAKSAPEAATMPSAEVSWSSGTIRWTFTPTPMIAGPSSATKKTMLCNGPALHQPHKPHRRTRPTILQ